MWRFIKFLFSATIITIVVLSVTGYRVGGKTVPEYLQYLASSKGVKEGMKDIRVLIGEAFKAVGSEIADEVTVEERKQLEDLVKKELEKGKPIEGAPNQTALPPEKKKNY